MELTVGNLHKTFKGTDGEPDFSLDIGDISLGLGKVTFVMGPNGSGKSVFLRLLSGDLEPDRGVVTADQARIANGGEPWAAIVRQKAEENLALELTVGENLMTRRSDLSIIQRMFPFKGRDRGERVLEGHPELMRKFDQQCRNLSGGQKQTLAFLVAASQNHILLALDEFLAATDQVTGVTLRRMARDYAVVHRAAVLIASHDVEVALEDADRIVVLQHGRLNGELVRNSESWSSSELKSLLR
jgi:putative ABC transport system ATP-binding protein